MDSNKNEPNKSIDMKKSIRYRNIVKILGIITESAMICAIGCSLYLLLWSLDFTGIVMMS